MCKRKWRKVLASSLLSLTMLCTVMPEVSYAAVPAEDAKKAESVKKEKGAEAIDSTGSVDWNVISVANAVDIQEDRIQNVNIAEEGGYQVFKFIPAETKEYTFFSEGNYDTYGMLKSEDGSLNVSNDDRNDDCNFSITAELTAGKIYYCAAQMLDSEDIGSFLCMISSTASGFTLDEVEIKTFEITQYLNETEFYKSENSVEDLPSGGYYYRIICMEDQEIEGYVRYNNSYIYGAYVGVRFKNEVEEGIADTSSGSNALIYSIGGVDAAEIPITFIDSPIESMAVLANPWTTILPENEDDLIDNMTGLKIQINYKNGDTDTIIGNYDEWYIEGEDDWIYPLYRWKNYDENGSLALGSNAIIFTYLGAEIEVPVTVENNDVQSISIVKNPEKMVYDVFENTVDLFGLNLRIVYTDGTSETVTVTEHGRNLSIGKYRLQLTGNFQYDDNDQRTGLISIWYKGSTASYRPTVQTYASLIKNAVTILPGQTASVASSANAKCRIFRFVPLDTKEYIISSTGTFDTWVDLLDASGNVITSDDDGGENYGNFKLAYNLQAGKTYYYAVRMYDAGETGTFTVTLSGASAYTITYNLNGGVNHASNPAAYYSQAVNLQNPSRANYAFAGWYTDSAYKNKITQIPGNARRNYALYAKWEKVKTPGKVKLTSAVNNKAKKISVKYKKVKNVAGYEVAYATNKKFKKASSVVTGKTKATVGKLKKGKTYYVRVCAYNLDSTGQKIRGKWSSAKRVSVKK